MRSRFVFRGSNQEATMNDQTPCYYLQSRVPEIVEPYESNNVHDAAVKTRLENRSVAEQLDAFERRTDQADYIDTHHQGNEVSEVWTDEDLHHTMSDQGWPCDGQQWDTSIGNNDLDMADNGVDSQRPNEAVPQNIWPLLAQQLGTLDSGPIWHTNLPSQQHWPESSPFNHPTDHVDMSLATPGSSDPIFDRFFQDMPWAPPTTSLPIPTLSVDTRYDVSIDATDVTNSDSIQTNSDSGLMSNFSPPILSQPTKGSQSPTPSEVSATPSPYPDILLCPIEGCQTQFTGDYRRGNQLRHVRLKHNAVDFPCGVHGCRKIFQRQDARLKHHRSHHGHDLPLLKPPLPRHRRRRT